MSEFNVSGYVMNETGQSFFKLQRSFPPGGKITFEQAFASVGKKSGKQGKEFVSWLKQNYFNDGGWVFYKSDGSPYFKTNGVQADAGQGLHAQVPSDPARGAGKVLRRQMKNQVRRGTEITPDTIIKADYEKAQGLIDNCRDKQVLKHALNLSKHFAHKEEHMRHLIRRLEQVN